MEGQGMKLERYTERVNRILKENCKIHALEFLRSNLQLFISACLTSSNWGNLETRKMTFEGILKGRKTVENT